MGDLLSKDMIADLAINIINIVILFFVTKALVYKPVKKVLEERRLKLEKEAAETQRLQAEAAAEREKYVAFMKDADALRDKAVGEAQTAARAEADSILASARAAAEETRAQAEKEAAESREKAVLDAKNDIVDLAVTISEKILRRSVRDSDTLRAAESFFEDGNQ